MVPPARGEPQTGLSRGTSERWIFGYFVQIEVWSGEARVALAGRKQLGLVALLLLQLYRAGRQAEAPEVYRRARDTMAEGLGLEPSESLRALPGNAPEAPCVAGTSDA